ncbi:MAG: DUF4920 domain-containing protein, partial [Myxococcota bacterium]|nr:DUF4920 domain-containing protein [Myxococcota bacterium]
MRILVASLLLALFLPLTTVAEADVAAPPPGRDFGAGLRLSQATPLAAIVREPARFADRPVLVRGHITDVCQKKGCWLMLRDGSEHVRIRFQDYGFFLPKDSVGMDAWAEGRVSVETLSEREARHYESESRDGDPSRIQGPQRRLTFTASGVRLVRG